MTWIWVHHLPEDNLKEVYWLNSWVAWGAEWVSAVSKEQPHQSMPSFLLKWSWLTNRAYDDYFKAYSVAVMDRKDRPELLYGGKSMSLLS